MAPRNSPGRNKICNGLDSIVLCVNVLAHTVLAAGTHCLHLHIFLIRRPAPQSSVADARDHSQFHSIQFNLARSGASDSASSLHGTAVHSILSPCGCCPPLSPAERGGRLVGASRGTAGRTGYGWRHGLLLSPRQQVCAYYHVRGNIKASSRLDDTVEEAGEDWWMRVQG